MLHPETNRISEKYRGLLSLASERMNNRAAQLGNQDFSVQYEVLEYSEHKSRREIEDLQREIAELQSENRKLSELHRLAQILARRAGKFPFSIYFGLKRKYRRILRSIRNSTVGSDSNGSAISAYEAATRDLCKRYAPSQLVEVASPLHMQLGSGQIVRNAIERARSQTSDKVSQLPPSFSIITPFFRHDKHFRKCAESVAKLFHYQESLDASHKVEWIIVNDDPRFSEGDLRKLIPEAIASAVRIISDGTNAGISTALDKGIRAARNPWVMLLDCDDMIEENAAAILADAISQNPSVRYFSSAMIDIDEDGNELRRRKQEFEPSEIFSAGMVLGHLVTFSAQMYREYGGFSPSFSGVQDYDFALRISAREKVHRLPNHLYRYRWHGESVSVSRSQQQTRLTNKVRAEYFRNEFKIESSRSLTKTTLSAEPKALCVIRTQGKRLELLANAIESIHSQSIEMTPCVVVHGNAEAKEFVERNLRARLFSATGRDAVVLLAPDAGKKRGYPCNVGLTYLREHANEYDLVCFLDDDDHLLPRFGKELVDAIKLNDADFAYGMTNALPKSGAPFIQHNLLPATALLVGNFIPIHSYLLRTEVVLRSDISFDESLNYLEDWDFLVQVVSSGAKGVPLFEVVSEYRLLGDGNTTERNDQAHFDHCTKKVVSRGREQAKKIPATQFWAEVLDFPVDRRKPLSVHELAHLEATRNLFQPLEAK